MNSEDSPLTFLPPIVCIFGEIHRKQNEETLTSIAWAFRIMDYRPLDGDMTMPSNELSSLRAVPRLSPDEAFGNFSDSMQVPNRFPRSPSYVVKGQL